MRLLPASLQFTLTSKLIGGTRAARWLGVTVGRGCRIYSLDIASERWLLTVGDSVTISVGVTFITHDGVGWLVNDRKGRRYRYAPISVGSRSFVGARSIVMPGVRIGDDVVIAAGSVVTKSVPDGVVVAGNPARVIGRTEDVLRKVGDEWPSETEIVGESRRERVDSILDRRWKPSL